MTSTDTIQDRIRATGIIAIVRAKSPEEGLETALRLVDAGLGVIEVSFNTPNAPTVIERLVAARPDALVGAGTVLTPEDARDAARAGARFLLSPAYGEAVWSQAKDLGLTYIPGVYTAADVWHSLEAGLDVLKLFPAGALGPSGMTALLEPFPEVRFVPTGGVSTETAPAWLAAGAHALGLGGILTRSADPVETANTLKAAVQAARGS